MDMVLLIQQKLKKIIEIQLFLKKQIIVFTPHHQKKL